MNRYNRLGKNTFLIFIGNAGARLIGLLMLPLYTRWLSVDDYGITDIISVYVSFLLGMVTCCITESIFIFPKGQTFEKQKEYFSSGLFFSLNALLLTAVLFFLIDNFSIFLKGDNIFLKYRWFIYIMLFSTFLQQYIQQFVRSIDRMRIYSTTGIILTFSTALFSFFLIPKWGVLGYILSLVVANIVAMLYSAIFSKVYRYIALNSIKILHCKNMLKYSIPLVPNSIMWWFVSSFNRPLMEQYWGMHAIGIFAVAGKFPGILSMLFNLFSTSWQISVIEEYGKNGYDSFFNKIFKIVVTGLFICFLIITICSKFIISIFTTSEFYDAWRYIPILTLASVFSAVAALAGSTFSATRESKYFFYSSLWGAIVSIIANLILIPRYGIMGTSISVLLSFIIMAFVRILYSWKYVRIVNGFYYSTLILFAFLFVFTTLLLPFRLNVIVAFILLFGVCFSIRKIVAQLFFNLIKNHK